MAIHAMVDIETLGTKPNSVVLTVGGCKFDPFSLADPYDYFIMRLDVDEQTAQGRFVDDRTLAWWGRQAPEIQEEAFSLENRIDIKTFCTTFNKWLVGVDIKWAQGPRFDYGILESLFDDFDHHINWAYWQEADSRTIFNLMPGDPRKDAQGNQTGHHDALADAIVQAIAVQKSFDHFKIHSN